VRGAGQAVDQIAYGPEELLEAGEREVALGLDAGAP